MNVLLAFSALLIAQSRADVETSGPNGCGSTPHGTEVSLGRYYYKCNNGQLEPKGCVDDSKKQVPVGETFKLYSYQMRCKLGQDGFLSVEYDSCIIENTVVAPGGTFENAKHWYSCTREGNFVVEQLSGCVYNGKRLKKQERVNEAEVVLECRDADPLPTMVAVGCTDNGKQYGIGETFTDDRFLYSCSPDSNGSPKKQTYGCVKDGKTLYSYQTYTVGNTVYRCEVRKGKAAKHLLIGCVDRQNGYEELRKLGCHYTVGTPPFRYTVQCDQTGPESVVESKIACIYGGDKVADNSGMLIEPGCYRTIDNKNVGCKNGTAGVEFVTFEKDAANQNDLQLC